jgi:phage gp29-like protein
MSTVITKKEPKKRKPRSKDDTAPIYRTNVRSEVLEKKIVDVYVPPQPCWTPISVKQALDMHDRGQPQMSGRLADTMSRDSRIQACIHTLVFGILGLPFEWKWVSDEESDGGSLIPAASYKPSEKDLRYLEITKRWFSDLKSTSILQSILTHIINIGFAGMSKSWRYEENYKDTGEDIFIPECWVFHPSNVWFNTGTYEYNIVSFDKGLIIVGDSNTDERFQIIKHANSERPWMEGIVRSVGLLYMDKSYALTDWREYITNNANPLRVLETIREDSSRGGLDFSIQDLLIDIAKHRQVGLPIHLPEGHKLSIVEPKSNLDNGNFDKKIEQANKEIAIAILGQNLTTDVSSGSHAAAQVHETVLHDRIRAYTKTMNNAINQMVKEFYKYNFAGEITRVPIAYYNPEPPEDKKMKAEETKVRLDALSMLAQVAQSQLLSKEEIDMLKKGLV